MRIPSSVRGRATRLPSVALATLIVCLASPRTLGAQCPDGTPRPCATSRRPVAARVVPSAEARARRFLLLPFRNVTRLPAQEWLVSGAPLMLGESLGQFSDLSVVTEERLVAARRRLSIRADSQPDALQLRQLAEETDGWTAVSGNVYAAGPRLRLAVQALDVQTSRVILRAETDVASDADVRPAFDSLTVRLLALTGVRSARTDLVALTTRSTDAYRAYVQGVVLLQQSAYRRAQAAFATAVRLDSNFALAWERLAVSSGNANSYSLFEPASLTARALEQASRRSAQLPPRRREYVRAFHQFMSGQFVRGRATLDSLVATDPDDLDARETLAGMELISFDLDPASGSAPRLATSLNRALRLSREVLERDPGRRNVHMNFAFVYGIAGGWFYGSRPGIKGSFPSFGAMVLSGAMRGMDAILVPVLRDTLEDEPSDVFAKRAAPERTALRRVAAEAGMRWVERWLLSGPEDAEAHLFASRLAQLSGDDARALREFIIGDSLGIETALEIVPQRRLALLFRAQQQRAALAVADSLLRSGGFAQRGFVGGLDQGRGYGMATFLVAKRWADAGTAASARPSATPGQPACQVALDELSTTTGEAGGPALRAMTDTVARYFAEIAAVPTLSPCLDALVLLVNEKVTDLGQRPFAGSALLAAADAQHRAGDDRIASRAASLAARMDTTLVGEVARRPWVRSP